MHRLIILSPPSPLDSYVEQLWLVEGATSAYTMERVLPNGRMQIIINLTDGELRVHADSASDRLQRIAGPLISGVQTRYTLIDTAQQQAIMGVCFRAGCAPPFLRDSAILFKDRHVALSDVWGASAAQLQSRLLDARSARRRLEILADALLAKVDWKWRLHPAVAETLDAFGCGGFRRPVHDLARRCRVSQRRLTQLLSQTTGLSPNRLSRIWRLQWVLGELESNPAAAWADLATGGGYFDQPHMIREFRALAGLTPGEYRSVQRSHRNHVPDVVPEYPIV